MRRVLLALGVLAWPATAFASLPEPVSFPEKPPAPRWEETELRLLWPAPAAPANPWGCQGQESKLQVDRVRVLRNAERLRAKPSRFNQEQKPAQPVDAVQVWFSFLNAGGGDCTPPAPELYLDPGLTRSAWTRSPSSYSLFPRRTRQLLAEGDVPLGARAVWVRAPGSPLRLGIDLETGTAALFSPEQGAVGSASGPRHVAVPAPHPAYLRIPIGERFPGASMVQAGSRDECTRFFDLGIDDVYVVRGVERSGDVLDELVLDASFYRKQDEPRTNPECHRHTYDTNGYAVLVLPGGFSQTGREEDARTATFGARHLRRFRLPPGAGQVTLGFGDPMSPADALSIDFERRSIQVLRRSLLPRSANSSDLSREWLDRERDPETYLLTKYLRGQSGRTEPERSFADRKNACGGLRFHVGKTYVPSGEAEPLWETFKVLCPQEWGDAGHP